MKRITTILFVAALAVGCGKKDDDAAPAPTPPEQPAPKPVEPTEVAPEQAEADVPTATEFEAEANEQITADNLEKELAAIEKEIGE